MRSGVQIFNLNTLTVTGGPANKAPYWSGFTKKTFTRYTVTAPLP